MLPNCCLLLVGSGVPTPRFSLLRIIICQPGALLLLRLGLPSCSTSPACLCLGLPRCCSASSVASLSIIIMPSSLSFSVLSCSFFFFFLQKKKQIMPHGTLRTTLPFSPCALSPMRPRTRFGCLAGALSCRRHLLINK
jgi:hypothetical protein